MKSIAFLGDSITYGYGLNNLRDRYATLISKNLGYEEKNFGITGTLVAKARLNASDGKDFLSRLNFIDTADVAVIFGGTNDYFWSDKPIYGNGDGYFSCAIESICKYIINNRTDKTTLVVTPYPHNGIGNYMGGKSWNDANRHDTSAVNFNGHTLSDYCDVIQSTCIKYGVNCLNLHSCFDFNYKTHTLDGCHPNIEGHKLLSEAILNELKRII